MQFHRLLSTAEAARYLSLSVDAIKHHLRKGHLCPQKIGHSLVFTEKELQDFQNRRRKPGRPTKKKGE